MDQSYSIWSNVQSWQSDLMGMYEQFIDFKKEMYWTFSPHLWVPLTRLRTISTHALRIEESTSSTIYKGECVEDHPCCTAFKWHCYLHGQERPASNLAVMMYWTKLPPSIISLYDSKNTCDLPTSDRNRQRYLMFWSMQPTQKCCWNV